MGVLSVKSLSTRGSGHNCISVVAASCVVMVSSTLFAEHPYCRVRRVQRSGVIVTPSLVPDTRIESIALSPVMFVFDEPRGCKLATQKHRSFVVLYMNFH